MVIGVIAVVVIGADFLLPEERKIKLKAAVMPLIRPDQADATRKVTVYQSQGKSGEAVFSDQHHEQGARPRVVDNAKGTTFHSEKPLPEPDSVSGSHAKQTPLQQKAAAFQQARMDRVINQ